MSSVGIPDGLLLHGSSGLELCGGTSFGAQTENIIIW